MIYDVIGDIHGQADKLVGLLHQLGYQYTKNEQGMYFLPPPNHRTIFMGDLIDRGEKEVKTLEIVFAMIDAGVADCIMGNHEYNAIGYATLNQIANDGSYLRTHKPSHNKQHEAFLAEIPFGSKQHQYWLSRLYELPLWIETDHACFVHACWDEKSMNVLQNSCLTANHCITEEGMQATGQKGSAEYFALEQVLKGVETKLPEGLYITDNYGTKRHNIRVKWWLDNLMNRPVHEIAKVPRSDIPQLKALPKECRAESIDFQLITPKPIFIGHYWEDGTPTPLSKQVICTDYSAAINSGYLTCYQLDTNHPLPLSADNFVQFKHDNRKTSFSN